MAHRELRVAVPLRPNAKSMREALESREGNFPKILDCLLTAGFTPVLATLDTDLIDIDAVLIPGGGDISPACYGGEFIDKTYGINDEQDALDFALVTHAENNNLPLLGICRGAQLINVARGGTLYEDLPAHSQKHHHNISTSPYPDMFVTHEVELATDSRTARALAGHTEEAGGEHGTVRIPVRSAHHQCVRGLGSGLRIVASSDDGLVEAFEATTGWTVGVQWHPEAEATEGPLKHGLFAAFAAEAQRIRRAGGVADPVRLPAPSAGR